MNGPQLETFLVEETPAGAHDVQSFQNQHDRRNDDSRIELQGSRQTLMLSRDLLSHQADVVPIPDRSSGINAVSNGRAKTSHPQDRHSNPSPDANPHPNDI